MMTEREKNIRQLMDAEFHFMVNNIPERWSIIDAWSVYERIKKTDDIHALGILAECYSILAPYENEIIEYYLEFINNAIQNTSLEILRKICNEYHERQVALKAYGLIPEPQPQAPTIKDYMLLDSDDDKERLLKTLHTLIDGKRGKGVALVMLVCMELGLMTKPVYCAMLEEFPGMGSKQGFDKYMHKGYPAYRQEEIDCARVHLARFQSNI